MTPDVFFALFLVLVVVFFSDSKFSKKTVFCFLNRKQKTRKHINEKRNTNTIKFEISVFICANPRQNRPAPPVGKNSRSWALLLVHHWEMDQNHVILAAVWSMSALPPLVILSAHFETAVTFFPSLRFG